MSCQKCKVLFTVNEDLRTQNRQLTQQLNRLTKELEEHKRRGSVSGPTPKKRRRIVKIKNMDTPTPFSCTVCDPPIFLDTAAALSSHKMVKHGTRYGCPELGCSASFGKPSLLKDHRNVTHGMSDPYNCSVVQCGKQFATYNQQLYHDRTQHCSQYVCKKCEQKFAARNDLTDHEQSDTCFDSTDMKLAKRRMKGMAASAFGIETEGTILEWFQGKVQVTLEKTGGISQHRTHAGSGKQMSGSCDGVEMNRGWCIEVKVVESEAVWRKKVDVKRKLVKNGTWVEELLRAMFVYDHPIGHLILLYKNEYHHFILQWEKYAEYFDNYIQSTYLSTSS